MFLNRKGVNFSTIAGIVFLLVVLGIIISVFLINYPGFLFSAGNVAACKNWVDIQSTSYLKEVVDFPSPCVTTEEVIKSNDKNEIQEELARNLYLCWDQYGKGELDFYSDFLELDSHCRICSEIKFDESVRNKKIDLDEFEIYLINHRPPNSKETYAEFFTNTKNARLNLGEGSLDISKDIDYYSIFRVTKGKELSPEQLVDTVLGTAFGGPLVGIVLAIRTETAFPSLILIKKDDPVFNEICDDIYYNPQKLLSKS